MQRNSMPFLILLGFIVSGVFWYQYRFYRTPINVASSAGREIVLGTAHKDDIPAINNPLFEDVASEDAYLNDTGYGVMVQVGNRARFYPFQILVWHLVVNDTLNGRDLLITFDPLTYTSAVYDRKDTFGVSGRIWNSNTLLYDYATESLWSQLRGEAIDGTLAGMMLTRFASRVMTWSAYKTQYPNGQVLSRETGIERDYTQNPYEKYAASQAIWFPLDNEDARLAPRSLVYGARQQDGRATAFVVDKIEDFDTIQAVVGADEVLVPAYWFAWAAMYPETEIYSSKK